MFMIIINILILILIINKYGNPFGNLSQENRGMWNYMGKVFIGTLIILFVGITLRHMR